MTFLQYEEPSIVDILVLISFLLLLPLSEYLAARIVRAGLLGPIVVGIIYGEPLANILHANWQETFLALGYVGLILIIFKGGLQTRLDLLRRNLLLSACTAITGVTCPIGFAYLLCYFGFGYGAVETFIIGASLSATSIGTTFAVISRAPTSIDLAQTRVGTVLVSAAVIDDVAGLVMASVIQRLDGLNSGNLAWTIARPIVASAAMAVLTPLTVRYAVAPFYRSVLEPRLGKHGHKFNCAVLVLTLAAFVTIAAYAGSSVLYGSYLAGVVSQYLPQPRPADARDVHTLDLRTTYRHYFGDIQHYLLEPLFFASVGFAVPFLNLWTGKALWRGFVFALLMVLAKAITAVWIPLWDVSDTRALATPIRALLARLRHHPPPPHRPTNSEISVFRRLLLHRYPISPALLLGGAMVARGEIGLLIIQLGFNNTNYVSEAGFLTAIWAILLNTLIGPILVGVLLKRDSEGIAEGRWGAGS